MSSFLAIKKVFDLSASNNAQMLVGRQSRELSASGNDVVTTMKKHFDYTVDVTFDSAGGTVCPSAEYVLGKTYQDLPTTTRSSHIFQGWFTQLTGGTQILAESTVELSTTTLHAQWKYADVGTDYTEYVVQTTSSYKKTGIYSATRYSSASPVVVDWGDGNVEAIEGNISQLAHEYSSVGVFHVKISNISNFAASASNSTWYSTTSQNRYTFKDVVKTGSHCTTMPNAAFYYCSALSSISFLSSCFTSLTAIPPSAFYSCSGITTNLSSLPTRIKTLGSSAFQYCTGLTGIQDLRNTGLTSFTNSYIFANCTGVKEFKLPSNVGTQVGAYLFSNDNRLSTIQFPPSLTCVSYGMVAGCTGLKDITVPSNIQSINGYSFAGCTNLSSVTYETTALTSIGADAFYYDSALRDLNVPDTVKNIGSYAFYYCYSTYASALTLPSALTSLGAYAYQYCYNLKELEIPSGLTAIGNYAFAGCRSLSSITDYRLAAQTILAATFGSATGTGGTTYAGYSTRGSNKLRIYTAATGYDTGYWLDPLQNVDKCGFNVEYIDASYPETRVTYADGSVSSFNIAGEISGSSSTPTTQIPNLSNVVEINIGTDVTSIGQYAFYNCSSLTSVMIHDSVTNIGRNAFTNSGLMSLTIPDSVTSIGRAIFSGCHGLTSVTIGNGVTIIENGTFINCSSLTNVTIGDSVTSIESSAFASCSGLTSMTIPASVTSIGRYAFRNCSSLTSVVFNGKTLAQVQKMGYYSWGITDTSIITVS